MNDIFLKLAFWEKSIFFLVNKTVKNRIFDIFLPIITRLGEYNLMLIILISLFLLGILLGKKKAKTISILSIAVITLSRLSVQILKYLFNRPRPFFVYEDINVFTKTDNFSFPSGHAALAFSIATILFVKYDKFKWIFLALAILVGLSRIYLGLHYPSDIIAGASLGIAVGTFILYLENKINKLKIKYGNNQ